LQEKKHFKEAGTSLLRVSLNEHTDYVSCFTEVHWDLVQNVLTRSSPSSFTCTLIIYCLRHFHTIRRGICTVIRGSI